MLRIPCPYCGLRDEDEFRYGGEASVVRPADPATADDAAWADYLFFRYNVKGKHQERWLHFFGCQQWFLVHRDTLTNEISGTSRIGENAKDD